LLLPVEEDFVVTLVFSFF